MLPDLSALAAALPQAQDLAPLALAGLAAGFVAGLFGVGGGTVLVPVLLAWFDHLGTRPALAMKTAVGTSLATIIITSWSSSRAHAKRGNIDASLRAAWLPGIAIGAIAGVVVSLVVSGDTLKLIFGAFFLALGLFLLVTRDGAVLFQELPKGPGQALLALAIGTLSSLIGIGGGAAAVPIMTVCNVPLKKAVGTASTFGGVIALPATLGFVISGWQAQGLPPVSLGYVSLAALSVLLPATALMAPVGAMMAHRLDRGTLRRLLALFLSAVSLKMLWH